MPRVDTPSGRVLLNGTYPCKVEVNVLTKKEQFPEALQSSDLSMLWEINLTTQQNLHFRKSIYVRIDFDDKDNLIAVDSKDTPLKERHNIKEVHDFLDAIEFNGGFNRLGEFIKTEGTEDTVIEDSEISNHVNSHLLMLDEYPLLVNFYVGENYKGEEDTKISFYMKPNSEKGWDFMNKKYPDKVRKPQSPAPPVPSQASPVTQPKPPSRSRAY